MVQAAERCRDVSDRTAQRWGVGDVSRDGRDRHAVTGQAAGRCGEPVGAAGDEPDRSTLGGKRVSYGESDTAAGSGDQHAGAAQAKFHESTLPPAAGPGIGDADRAPWLRADQVDMHATIWRGRPRTR